MSVPQLSPVEELQGSGALSPHLTPDELAAVHEPFDVLTGTGRYEQRLADALLRRDAVAVVGPSGLGKSSVVAALEAADNGLVVLRIPVADHDRDHADGPAPFARHVLGVLARLDRPATPSRSRLRLREASARLSVGTSGVLEELSVVPNVSLELAGTVAREAQDLTDSALTLPAPEVAEHVKSLLDHLADGQVPVVALDDTDRLAAMCEVGPDEVRTRLFDESIRWLQETEASVVAAAQPAYLDRGQLPQIATVVRLPELTEPQLTSLLHNRADRCSVSVEVFAEAVEHGAIRQLFAAYRRRGASLKATLTVLGEACDLAIEAGDSVSAALIRAADDPGERARHEARPGEALTFRPAERSAVIVAKGGDVDPLWGHRHRPTAASPPGVEGCFTGPAVLGRPPSGPPMPVAQRST